MDEETEERFEEVRKNIEVLNKRFDHMKKIIGDYLELSSSLSMSSVKANLKNV